MARYTACCAGSMWPVRVPLRAGLIVLSVALVLVAPSVGFSQPHQSFQDLALLVNVDDRLQIKDESGMKTAGRLTQVTRDEIVILTDAGERRFTSTAVRTLTVRRMPRRKGILIGAGVGAAGRAGGLHRFRPRGVRDRPAPAQRRRRGRRPGPERAPRPGDGRLPSPFEMGARGLAGPPGPFDDLALRVNLDDRVRVEDRSGTKTTGRLVTSHGHRDDHRDRGRRKSVHERRRSQGRRAPLLARQGCTHRGWRASRRCSRLRRIAGPTRIAPRLPPRRSAPVSALPSGRSSHG